VDTVNAIEALSLLLTHALDEDPSGYTQSFVPCVLCSLLGLDMALKEYMQTVQSSFPGVLGTGTGTGIGKHFRKANRISGFRGVKISEVISQNFLSIALAVEEALNRIIRGYSDVIPTYSFPSNYATNLHSRLVRGY
jgi:hypothetical protein